MLAPSDRRLLLDALSPPPGFALDQAVGTTYTLDLLALLRVPLAATALPWSEGDGEPLANPFALLSALRTHAGRISLFCHAGAIKVPPRQQALFTLLEPCVNQVVPPRSGVFHPKLWLLRFRAADGETVAYRLLVVSRNLTFDRCWDIALVLDGELLARRRAIAVNHPLADLIGSLPAMAAAAGAPVADATANRVSLVADEVRRVRWETPEDFELRGFHVLGGDAKAHWPFEYLHRLLVVSPFLSGESAAELGRWPYAGASLVARLEELAKLPAAALADFDEVFAFDDGQGLLDAGNPAGDDSVEELAGLHAKLFLGEADRRARVWVGSANATQAALGAPNRPAENVELLVELDAVRSRHGITATRDGLLDAGLVRKFAPDAQPESDEAAASLERDLERLATRLASGALRAEVVTEGVDRHRVAVRQASGPVELEAGTEVTVRPITVSLARRAHLDRDPVALFPVVALVHLTPFFAFSITARRGDLERQHEFVARLPLEGVPDGRTEAVIAELLSDRDRLIAFLLLLLAVDGGDAEHALERLERIGAGDLNGRDGAGAPGLPLLEPLLRALDRDPTRLDEIARLLTGLEASEQTAGLVPEELRDLWAVIESVRES